MDTKTIRRLALVMTIPLICAASCNKTEPRPCVNSRYGFAVTSQWYPQKEIYLIGDTISIVTQFPTSLVDLTSSNLIDYSNSVGIGGSYIFYEMDTVQVQVKGAVSKFNFITTVGSISEGSIIPNEQKIIAVTKQIDGYKFECKIIPRFKGLYCFYISDLASRGLAGKDCTNAGFSNTLINTNKNIHLFQYAMNRPPASQFEIDRIYCFRVQ